MVMTRSQRASTPRNTESSNTHRSNVSGSTSKSNTSSNTGKISSLTNTTVVSKRHRKKRHRKKSTCNRKTHVLWKATGRCRKKCLTKTHTRIMDTEDPRYGRCLMKCTKKPRTERGPRYCRKPCGATHKRIDRKKGRGTRCVRKSYSQS